MQADTAVRPTARRLIVPGRILRPSAAQVSGLAVRPDPSGLSLPADRNVPDYLAKWALFRSPHVGNVYTPPALRGMISLPGGGPLRSKLKESGVVLMVQRRPRRDELGRIVGFDLVADDVSHNERVDRGAVRQDLALFGSTSMAFTAVAVASATLTKTKTDESLGSASANATTNEYTTIGLSRAAGSLGTYTAPASLGATFSRVISRAYTASGGGTAYGSGLFDSVTVSGSFLYVEDNFGSTAVLVSGDQLTVTWTISN